MCVDVFKEELAGELDQQFWFISNVMYRVVIMQQNSFSLVLIVVLRIDIILIIICSSTVSTVYTSFSYVALLLVRSNLSLTVALVVATM